MESKDFVIKDGVLTKYIGPGGEVTIPAGVKAICSYAFCSCTNLQSVTIPKSVKKIGKYAFCDCNRRMPLIAP